MRTSPVFLRFFEAETTAAVVNAGWGFALLSACVCALVRLERAPGPDIFLSPDFAWCCRVFCFQKTIVVAYLSACHSRVALHAGPCRNRGSWK